MTDSEIRQVFLRLRYERDDRKPPDNRRRGQFRAGWKRDEVREETLNEKLTWHNLGHRMGQHFGPQSDDERIGKAYQVLAVDYRSGVTPLAKKAASKANKKASPRRQRSVGKKPKSQPQRNDFPDEIDENVSLPEGAKQRVTVNRYERNPRARQRCIAHYGKKCCICGFSFEDTYGEIVEDFIHVHHVKPLSEIGKRCTVDPVEDLRPVCPNCHAVIHIRQGEPAFSVEEVKIFLQRGEPR